MMSASERVPDAPFRLVNGDAAPEVILVCDHASAHVPARYDGLGLPREAFERHIAYDIGAAGVVEALAGHFNCPAVLAGFSRLLIDANRGPDDPTLVMKLSDGAIIPANRQVDAFHDVGEFERRRQEFYLPYHQAIADQIERALALNIVPVLISVHSFTPVWRGFVRPWQVGILWDRDDRIARPLIDRLRAEPDLTVGDNQPYSGVLEGDCMYRHGTMRGLPHVLVELNQSLIAPREGQRDWAARLAPILREIMARPGVREICYTRPKPAAQSVPADAE